MGRGRVVFMEVAALHGYLRGLATGKGGGVARGLRRGTEAVLGRREVMVWQVVGRELKFPSRQKLSI